MVGRQQKGDLNVFADQNKKKFHLVAGGARKRRKASKSPFVGKKGDYKTHKKLKRTYYKIGKKEIFQDKSLDKDLASLYGRKSTKKLLSMSK
jgi:hypothetical protein